MYKPCKQENKMNRYDKLLVVLYAVVIAALLFSCKNIEKATQTVLTNEAAFAKVGEKWATLNPCNADSTIEYIHGETYFIHDTAIELHTDTTMIKRLTDSLIDLNLTTDAIVAASYESGYKNALKEHPPIHTVTVDTLRKTLTEKRRRHTQR